MSNSSSLFVSCIAEFSGTVTSPLSLAAVLAAGVFLRWRAWGVRLAAVLIGLLHGLPAGLEVSAFHQAAALVGASALGALLLAEFVLTALIPLGRLLGVGWAIARDICRAVTSAPRHRAGGE